MATNLFDELMDIFSNIAAETEDYDAFLAKLEEVGIPHELLELVADEQEHLENISLPNTTFRVYTKEESDKLSTMSRGFLLFLERTSMMSVWMRETIIDSAMQSPSEVVGIDEFKQISFATLVEELDAEETIYVKQLLFHSNQQSTPH